MVFSESIYQCSVSVIGKDMDTCEEDYSKKGKGGHLLSLAESEDSTGL